MKKVIAILALVFCFACEDGLAPPEISPDLNIANVGIRTTNPDLDPVHFDIQLSNLGDEVLKIESMTVLGNENCSFSFEGPDTMEIVKSGSAFVRGFFHPTVVGDEHVALEIVSNSHVDSTLTILVCGKAVAPGTDQETVAPIEQCQMPTSGPADCGDPDTNEE